MTLDSTASTAGDTTCGTGMDAVPASAAADTSTGTSSSAAVASANDNDNDNDDIVSRYDRQVRLWGAESQQKMMKSRVLYIHVTGISAEILKNLALAGIKATLCDSRDVNAVANRAPHFLTPPASSSSSSASTANKRVKYSHVSVAHSVQPLVEEMNPLLEGCPILEKTVEELTAEDLKAFTVIVASQIPLADAIRLSQWATSQGSQFYLVDCFGYHGACLLDLGKDYHYRPEVGKQVLDPVPLWKKKNNDPNDKEKKHVGYTSLEELVQVPLHHCVNRFHKSPPPVYLQYRCLLEYQAQKGYFPGEGDDDDDDALAAVELFATFLKSQQASLPKESLEALGRAGMAQVAPVCAILGGILGNEIIKVISGKAEPANNTLLFDGTSGKAWTFLVQPPSSTAAK